MNKENLQKMADYIRTIPQEKFGMGIWRKGDRTQHKCDSVGCVIGHCVALDKLENIPFDEEGEIIFDEWSEKFTGISMFDNEWDWCFVGDWTKTDNTPEGAVLRIEWLLKNGLPKDWEEQMEGYAPLCYKGDKA